MFQSSIGFGIFIFKGIKFRNLTCNRSYLCVYLRNGAAVFGQLVQLGNIFFQRINGILQCLFVALVVGELCIDGGSSVGDSITEIKFGIKPFVFIPTDQNLACKYGGRRCNGFTVQNRLGFFTQCAIVKCNGVLKFQCKVIAVYRYGISTAVAYKLADIGSAAGSESAAIIVLHRDTDRCILTGQRTCHRDCFIT